MLNKYRESRKKRVTLTDDFERRTQKFHPITLGYWGLVSHVTLFLSIIGVALYLTSFSEVTFFEVFLSVGFWVWWSAIFGGVIMFAFVLYAIGSIPFLFSSVARRRLTKENATLKNINTALALFDKTIFIGLIVFQAAFPLICFADVVIINQG